MSVSRMLMMKMKQVSCWIWGKTCTAVEEDFLVQFQPLGARRKLQKMDRFVIDEILRN